MKALAERLFWVRLFADDLAAGTLSEELRDEAIIEANCCLAIAEVLNLPGLAKRIDVGRHYLFRGNTEVTIFQARDALSEAHAVAEELPEITITLPMSAPKPAPAVAPDPACYGGLPTW